MNVIGYLGIGYKILGVCIVLFVKKGDNFVDVILENVVIGKYLLFCFLYVYVNKYFNKFFVLIDVEFLKMVLFVDG